MAEVKPFFAFKDMARPEITKTLLGQRLRAVRKQKGDHSRVDFAATLGIAEKTLSNHERGDSVPDANVLSAYRERYGVNVNWLVTGEGDMFGDDPETRPFTEGDFALIPAYDHRYSAGHGAALASEGHPDREIALSRRWLRQLGVHPEHVILAYADGDSMTPTIPDKAPMLIDTSVQEVRHGQIYALNLDGYLIVKRINHRIDGSIELISDNRENYPVQIVDRSRLDQTRVIGRVVLAMQQF